LNLISIYTISKDLTPFPF